MTSKAGVSVSAVTGSDNCHWVQERGRQRPPILCAVCTCHHRDGEHREGPRHHDMRARDAERKADREAGDAGAGEGGQGPEVGFMSRLCGNIQVWVAEAAPGSSGGAQHTGQGRDREGHRGG